MALLSALDRAHSVAPPGYSRWLIPPAALSVHLCIGQAYATSVYKNSLVQHFDTSQTAIGIVFSIAIVMLGLSAAVGGTWVEASGPRKAMFVSASFWASGFLVGAPGCLDRRIADLCLGEGRPAIRSQASRPLDLISARLSICVKWAIRRLRTGMAIACGIRSDPHPCTYRKKSL
jgi:hypothetical protein